MTSPRLDTLTPVRPRQCGSPWPKISIVTPSYNQGRFIERTIRSVLGQGYPNLEYVIIDGGSTDDSVQIIRKYENHLTYWVSESDRGQSHAINKGLTHCTGEIFNWLNSDDFLAPGALATVAAAWTRRPGTVIAGNIVMRYEDGTMKTVASNALTVENFVRWRRGYENGCAFQQPSTFVPLAAVSDVGGIREDLNLVMDHFLMIELLQRCDVTYIPDVLSQFTLHNASKTRTEGYYGFMLEIAQTLRTLPNLPVDVSDHELRREHARVLVRCAEMDGMQDRVAAAGCKLAHAMWLSPRDALSELRGQRVVSRFLRMLLHKTRRV